MAASIIQQKLTDGTLKGFWDFRLRAVFDLTGTNDGSLNGTPAFTRDGLLYQTTSDYVNMGNSDTLNFTDVDFTLFFGIRSYTSASDDVLSRRAGVAAANVGFILGTAAGGEVFYEISDGSTEAEDTSTVVVTDGDPHWVVVTFDRSGDATIYIDGVADGTQAISGVGSITNATNFLAGRNADGSRIFSGTIMACGAMSGLLTAAEAAQLTSELSTAKYPEKASSIARTDVTPPISLGAAAAWNMKPIEGNVTDSVGGNNGVIGIGLYYNRSIMGDAMVFPGVNANAIQVVDAADIDVGTGDFTIGYWVKTTASGSIMRIVDKRSAEFGDPGTGYTVGMSATGTTIGGIGDGTTNISDETVLSAGVINDGLWHLVLAEFDRDGLARAHVDNVAGAATSISSITNTLNNATDLYIGQQSFAAAEPFDGELSSPMLFKKILSVAEKSLLYDLGSKAVAFKTGWGVNQSVANVTSGQIENSVFTRDSGTWQIGFDEIKGNLVKTLECVASGVAYADVLTSGQTPTQAAYGTWEFYLYKDAVASFVQFISTEIGTIAATGQDGYYIKFDGNEKFILGETVNGSGTELYRTSSSYLNNQQWYKVKITRTFDGKFTFALDGTDLPASGEVGTNPVTNTDVTVGRYFNVDLDTDDIMAYSSIKGDYSIKTTQTISTGGSSA